MLRKLMIVAAAAAVLPTAALACSEHATQASADSNSQTVVAKAKKAKAKKPTTPKTIAAQKS